MGIADKFNDRLHQELKAHVAWFPVANTFALGDYGLVSGGVFTRLGNIAEYRITAAASTGKSAGASLNFSSDGTRIVRVAGGAEVDALPEAPINAKLAIEFSSKDSFLLKAATATTEEITNVAAVARQLASTAGWRRKYKVVWGTVTGEHCTIVTSRAAGAKLELSGTAEALRQIDLASASANFNVESEREVGFTSIGRTGIVGLRLFKLRWFGDEARMLGPTEAAEFDLVDVREDDV